MKIIIDGDSCKQKDTIIKIAQKKKIPVHIYCDYNHEMEDDYAEIHIVEQYSNEVDFAIVNKVEKDDIVVTNDIGLAALVLSRYGRVINNWGIVYTKKNINSYLTNRHMRERTMRKYNHMSSKSRKGLNIHSNSNITYGFTNSLLYLIRKTNAQDL